MNKKLRVGVIFGGRSGEHEVSLVSATSVINALDKEKYDVVPIGITHSGRWISSSESLKLLKTRIGLENEPERVLLPEPNRRSLVALNGEASPDLTLDVVFPLVHGTFGEDGTLQGLLELANIPYVGAGVLASAVGMDKIVQKQLHKQAGLPIVKYDWFYADDCRNQPKKVASKIDKVFRYPVFIKPSNTGSSVGISKVHDKTELKEALLIASDFDRKVIVEQGIKDVREIEVSVLGNDKPIASMPGEIIPSNEFYDYDAKYVDGKSASEIPAKLPQSVARQVQKLAVKAFTVLDCAGMARVDFFVTRKTNKVFLNEINTIPGFTSISMYPKLWEASGLSYRELLDRLIEFARDRHKERNRILTAFRPEMDWHKQS